MFALGIKKPNVIKRRVVFFGFKGWIGLFKQKLKYMYRCWFINMPPTFNVCIFFHSAAKI
ncbi:MAG: hypothetical protein EAZ15_01360 [Sphingobacteriales bacterium]|nr:MAG: hypothetical protein EAZ15_01360 [Sphingobacteriales bacterium]